MHAAIFWSCPTVFRVTAADWWTTTTEIQMRPGAFCSSPTALRMRAPDFLVVHDRFAVAAVHFSVDHDRLPVATCVKRRPPWGGLPVTRTNWRCLGGFRLGHLAARRRPATAQLLAQLVQAVRGAGQLELAVAFQRSRPSRRCRARRRCRPARECRRCIAFAAPARSRSSAARSACAPARSRLGGTMCGFCVQHAHRLPRPNASDLRRP